jgi:gamma-glutamyltranspeptidase / glutathione hydrolase
MSESPTVHGPTGSLPSIAHGPPGCAAVAAGGRDTVLAAAAVLRAGGNAVDAALAGVLAACVSEVVFTSLGGGGFLVVHEPAGEEHVLDFFVNTPGLGQTSTDESPDFTPITVHYPGADQVFHVGPGSVAVPGALAGVLRASEQYGRLPMAQLVAPAIELARNGAILEPVQAIVLDLVREIMSLTEECARLISTPHGHAVAGDRLHNNDLARFLRRLGEGQITSLTSLPFADPLMDLMTHTSGHITADDLAHYQVIDRPPTVVERNGARIVMNAPPAFGGVIVADALRRLDIVDGSPQAWAATASALQAATDANRVADQKAGIPHVTQGTTHISVVDADGMVASMTTSNGAGSGVVHPGTGIHLNNMLGEEDLNPGGFHSLPPGIRMGSMMAPAVVTSADGAVTGLGTGGSERIRSTLLLCLVHLVDRRLPIEAVVAAPRLHPSADGLQMEPGWDPEVARIVGQREPVNLWSAANLYFGGMHAVTRHADGRVTAVGDSRRGGAAAVIPL